MAYAPIELPIEMHRNVDYDRTYDRSGFKTMLVSKSQKMIRLSLKFSVVFQNHSKNLSKRTAISAKSVSMESVSLLRLKIFNDLPKSFLVNQFRHGRTNLPRSANIQTNFIIFHKDITKNLTDVRWSKGARPELLFVPIFRGQLDFLLSFDSHSCG